MNSSGFRDRIASVIKKLRKLRKVWPILVILGIVILGLLIKSQKSKKEPETVKVMRGEIVESVSTSGKVVAPQTANLTFQTGGKVAWIGVKEGDWVRTGQGIASLDTIILNATYQQALNNYRNLQAAAENVLDSVKDHSGDETFTQKATRTAAEVARDNAYDTMIAAKHTLGLATITSPFGGIIDSANPSFPGVNVTPATASYVVVNPTTLFFEAEIDETDLPKVKTGQEVGINLDAYSDETFTGKITFIGFVATTSETGGNAYKVKISLPKNLDLKFRVGMEGDAEIILRVTKNVLKVPTSSVINEGDKNYVMKGDEKVEVTLGTESQDEVEVKFGLNENDEINLTF